MARTPSDAVRTAARGLVTLTKAARVLAHGTWHSPDVTDSATQTDRQAPLTPFSAASLARKATPKPRQSHVNAMAKPRRITGNPENLKAIIRYHRRIT
jgi:hypothetical protein